jgi:Cdc6-like AAA superfamily ATPase
MTNEEELYARERAVKQAFSPSAPINRRDLFAGRAEQMMALIDVADEPGQHGVLFGERGVGKTSLATVTSNYLAASNLTVRVNCQAQDTFSSAWRKAFSEITISRQIGSVGFNSQDKQVVLTVPESFNLPADIGPDHVRAVLGSLGSQRPVVIFFDEFDRISDLGINRSFADTIKTLSDHVVPATVILVGVADNVGELVAEHASIERGLGQIAMPRMSVMELAEIVTRGLASVDMTIEQSALRRITALSQGLPHYTHLLAQQAAVVSVLSEQTTVDNRCVDEAITASLHRAQESIASLYYKATYSARENLYKQVLLACARARADDRGFFSASTVRESLSDVLGRRVEIPQFAMHLNAFSSDRGPVLRKEGSQRKFRYRFVNPLLQPYVIMRGVVDGLITSAALDSDEPTS